MTAFIDMDKIFLIFKLNTNTINIKLLVCSKQTEPKINITIKGNRIKQVELLKYLGSINKQRWNIIRSRYFYLRINY